MRTAIHAFANHLRALPRMLRAYRWRLESLIEDTIQVLAQGISNQGARRMRPIPIRIDERRDPRG